MKLSAESESALYGWLTRLRYQHPAEYRRFYRHGTPSDVLVGMAGEACPVSLTKRSGQDAAYTAMARLEQWTAAVPTLVRWRLDAAYAVADARRSAKARETARSVFRFVLLRAAHESNPQPVCAFESIQAAVERDLGRVPNRETVKNVLTLANESAGPLSVVTWGERGTFHRSTVLRVDLPPFTDAAASVSERAKTDEWLMLHGHVLEAVLRREAIAVRTRADRKAAYAAAVEAKRAKYNAQAAQFHADLTRMIQAGDRTLLTLPSEPANTSAHFVGAGVG